MNLNTDNSLKCLLKLFSSVILAMIAGSAALDFATGLPLLFAVFALVSLCGFVVDSVRETFGLLIGR